MKTYKLVWSPSGQAIATVQARTLREARRKAPMPWRKYLGEIYAEQTVPIYYGWTEASQNGQAAWFCTAAAAKRFALACGWGEQKPETTTEPNRGDVLDTPSQPWTKS